MKRPVKKTYYIVYPPNYTSSSGNYYEVKNKIEAMKIAKRLGEGSELHARIDKHQRNGCSLCFTPYLYDWKGKKYWCNRRNHWYRILNDKKIAAKENLVRSISN